jgi:MFS family permease
VSGLLRQLGQSFLVFAETFRKPNLRRLQVAWAGSTVARWAYAVGIAVFAYEAGGTSAVAVVAFVRLSASALTSPFSSLLADRYPREYVMIGANALRAAALLAAAAAAWASLPALAVYAAAVVVEIATGPFRPAQGAILPSLCDTPEELTAANVGSSTIEGTGMFIGPALGGLLLAVTDAGTVFAACAAVMVVSAAFVVRIRRSREVDQVAPSGHLLSDLFAGFTTIGREANLRFLFALFGAQIFVAGALTVLIVLIGLRLLDVGAAGVGYLQAAVGIGGLLGTIAALGLLLRRLAVPFAAGLLLWGAPIALIGVVPDVQVALAMLCLVGVGNTLVDVAGYTFLQRVVPNEVLARVLGVLEALFFTMLALGALVVAPLVHWLGVRGALVATGCCLPVVAAVTWRRLMMLDAEAVPPSAETGLLARIPMFAPLAPPVLEELARALVPVKVEAGETLIRQGDQGDRFYAIAAGEVDVSADGALLATHGPGGYFGEIALLQDVPRTATVTARTEAVLYALERDIFLSAVTGHAASSEAAEAVVATRLSSLRPSAATL